MIVACVVPSRTQIRKSVQLLVEELVSVLVVVIKLSAHFPNGGFPAKPSPLYKYGTLKENPVCVLSCIIEICESDIARRTQRTS